ncbi:hypothetical protein CYMTET_8199 [Cymbomonas tetramitiformis]|uniref:LRRK2 ARM repeat domain-containing protein n=1 Tax=Cymbomonas tetramitiformis TaxID=36881 RepID=A0AAE0LG38_9CHLO|nr:hypothetical protein CYMTET_8199 [Cymbomonas tetramitiformis]
MEDSVTEATDGTVKSGSLDQVGVTVRLTPTAPQRREHSVERYAPNILDELKKNLDYVVEKNNHDIQDNVDFIKRALGVFLKMCQKQNTSAKSPGTGSVMDECINGQEKSRLITLLLQAMKTFQSDVGILLGCCRLLSTLVDRLDANVVDDESKAIFVVNTAAEALAEHWQEPSLHYEVVFLLRHLILKKVLLDKPEVEKYKHQVDEALAAAGEIVVQMVLLHAMRSYQDAPVDILRVGIDFLAHLAARADKRPRFRRCLEEALLSREAAALFGSESRPVTLHVVGVVSMAMHKFTEVEEVQACGCAVLCAMAHLPSITPYLSFDVNPPGLVHADAIVALTTALNNFPRNASLQVEACQTLQKVAAQTLDELKKNLDYVVEKNNHDIQDNVDFIKRALGVFLKMCQKQNTSAKSPGTGSVMDECINGQEKSRLITLLLQAMKTFQSDVGILLGCCRLLSTLVDRLDANVVDDESKAIFVVNTAAEALAEHWQEPSLHYEVVFLLRHLILKKVLLDKPEVEKYKHQVDEALAAAGEIVVQMVLLHAMRSYQDAPVDILRVGIDFLAHLAARADKRPRFRRCLEEALLSREAAALFGSESRPVTLHVVGVVSMAMHKFTEVEEVQACGCAVLCAMAHLPSITPYLSFDVNPPGLVHADAIVALTTALNNFPRNASLQVEACQTLQKVAAQTLRGMTEISVQMMVLKGAALMVVNAMRHHRADMNVQIEGCKALHWFLEGDKEEHAVHHQIIQDGGARVLVDAMTSPRTELAVCLSACKALCMLTTILGGGDSVVIAGGVEAAVELMSDVRTLTSSHDSDLTPIVRDSCNLLSNLSGQHRGRITAADGVNAVLAAMAGHPHDVDVQFYALLVLASQAPHMVTGAGAAMGMLEPVTSALRRYAGTYKEIDVAGLRFLRRFLHASQPASSELLDSCSALEVQTLVAEAMRRHPCDLEVCADGCMALTQLASQLTSAVVGVVLGAMQVDLATAAPSRALASTHSSRLQAKEERNRACAMQIRTARHTMRSHLRTGEIARPAHEAEPLLNDIARDIDPDEDAEMDLFPEDQDHLAQRGASAAAVHEAACVMCAGLGEVFWLESAAAGQEDKLLDAALLAMRTFPEVMAVQDAGLRALANLAAVVKCRPGLMKGCLEVEKAVRHAMRVYDENSSIQAAGLRCFRQLVQDSSVLQEAFAEGATEDAVAAMKAHPGVLDVCLGGCLLLELLTENFDTVDCVVSQGALEAVVAVLRTWPAQDRHHAVEASFQISPMPVEARSPRPPACAVIRNCSRPPSLRACVLRSGAAHEAVRAMLVDVEEACGMVHIAVGVLRNLVEKPAQEAAEPAREACDSASAAVVEELVDAGAVEAVLSWLHAQFCLGNDMGARHVTPCEGGTHMSCERCHVREALETGCGTLRRLAWCPAGTKQAVRCGAMELLPALISAWEGAEVLQREARSALVSLLAAAPELVDHGGPLEAQSAALLVAAAMEEERDVLGVQLAGCTALAGLMQFWYPQASPQYIVSSIERTLLDSGEAGGPASSTCTAWEDMDDCVIAALRRHPEHHGMHEAGLQALVAIAAARQTEEGARRPMSPVFAVEEGAADGHGARLPPHISPDAPRAKVLAMVIGIMQRREDAVAVQEAGCDYIRCAAADAGWSLHDVAAAAATVGEAVRAHCFCPQVQAGGCRALKELVRHATCAAAWGSVLETSAGVMHAHGKSAELQQVSCEVLDALLEAMCARPFLLAATAGQQELCGGVPVEFVAQAVVAMMRSVMEQKPMHRWQEVAPAASRERVVGMQMRVLGQLLALRGTLGPSDPAAVDAVASVMCGHPSSLELQSEGVRLLRWLLAAPASIVQVKARDVVQAAATAMSLHCRQDIWGGIPSSDRSCDDGLTDRSHAQVQQPSSLALPEQTTAVACSMHPRSLQQICSDSCAVLLVTLTHHGPSSGAVLSAQEVEAVVAAMHANPMHLETQEGGCELLRTVVLRQRVSAASAVVFSRRGMGALVKATAHFPQNILIWDSASEVLCRLRPRRRLNSDVIRAMRTLFFKYPCRVSGFFIYNIVFNFENTLGRDLRGHSLKTTQESIFACLFQSWQMLAIFLSEMTPRSLVLPFAIATLTTFTRAYLLGHKNQSLMAVM